MNFSHRLVFAGKSNGTFVQCSRIKCAKWRFLPEFEDPALVSAATKSFLNNNIMPTTDTNTNDNTSICKLDTNFISKASYIAVKQSSNYFIYFTEIESNFPTVRFSFYLKVPADWECSMNWDVRLNSCEKGKSEEWVEASNEMVRNSTNF